MHIHDDKPNLLQCALSLQDVGFKLMPKISHRNTRRYSDEGRERVLRAAGKLVAPIQEQSHLPARNSSPRRRK